MSRKFLFQILAVAALIAILAGCAAATEAPKAAAPVEVSKAAAPTEASKAAATEAPKAAATEAPKAAEAAKEKVTGTFYWVQETAWHPVHQLVQLSFMEGCKERGLKCELFTTDESGLEPVLMKADQVLAQPDIKGFAIWTGGHPGTKPVIEKAKAAGLPVCLPHAKATEGQFADNAFSVGGDPSVFADPAAKALCDQLKGQKGSVAFTENTFNPVEDAVVKYMSEGLTKYCPDLKLLKAEEEGAEPTKAIAKAVSIMQANPDLVAAVSSTGGGATTWAGAQKETGKKIVAVGVDYTRVNLDLVKSGQIFGVIAQPLYEEAKGCADLLFKAANGEKNPVFTVAPAPLVTTANIDEYYKLLDRMEGQMRPTPTPKP